MTDEQQRPTDDIPGLTDPEDLGPGPRGQGGEGTGTFDLGDASASSSANAHEESIAARGPDPESAPERRNPQPG